MRSSQLAAKLRLPSAARSIYAEDGSRVTEFNAATLARLVSDDAGKPARLWVTCGEPLRQPASAEARLLVRTRTAAAEDRHGIGRLRHARSLRWRSTPPRAKHASMSSLPVRSALAANPAYSCAASTT